MKHRLIIFDADGTLRRCTVPGQKCPNAPGQWEWMPNVRETLGEINWGSIRDGGVGLGIASNQAGVHYGYLAGEVACRLLEDLAFRITGRSPVAGSIQICPHSPAAGCACRKPRPLMLRRIMEVWDVPPDLTLFVGDMESDEEAARNGGCDFLWAHDFFGWGGSAWSGAARPRSGVKHRFGREEDYA